MDKKIIIIEGTDNVGKDTVIYQLLQNFDTIKLIHCNKPKSKDPEEAANEQRNLFWDVATENVHDYVHGKTDCIIHNRSWYGEYVYGCMYRSNNEDRVIKQINFYENYLLSNIPAKDICFITLLSNNSNFLVKNDDGLSISNAKKELIERETNRFKEIFELSNLPNKHIIYVNDGENWRSKQDIISEVLNYIKL